MKPTIETERFSLYLADCMDVLPEHGPVDAAITSPPYNLGGRPWEKLGHWKPGQSAGGKSKWKNGSDAGAGIQYGSHADSMPWPEYVAWQHSVLRALWSILNDDGAIFYNHKPRVIGARLWTPQELIPDEITTRQIITWARPGGLNFNPTAFVPTCEWIILLAKSAFRLKSRAVSGLGDVWRMTPDRNSHPAPFPLELPSRAIESLKESVSVVIDPFMGSGTTGVAAMKAGKRFVGIEKDPAYFEMAAARIASTARDESPEAYVPGNLW